MLRQIQYFQAVVKNNSFSRAAEECHISQSAISQQVQALERELGFLLLDRKNRTFTLTPAGAYFYQKSLILVDDYERICREAGRIAHGKNAALRVGCLRSYSGREFYRAVQQFSMEYPAVNLDIQQGNHEELYRMLQEEQADLALNDQRRAFSDAFVNLILTTAPSSVELSARSPLAGLQQIEPSELKNLPCILVTTKEQQETELAYYRDIVGFPGSSSAPKPWKPPACWRSAAGVFCRWRGTVGLSARTAGLCASLWCVGENRSPATIVLSGKRTTPAIMWRPLPKC